jgi:phosphohistidine phosphatase
MAKTVWLLRHFQALDEPPSGGRDRDRRLSPKGLRRAQALGEALGAGELEQPDPGLLLVSPAVRTQQTAEVSFAALGERVRSLTDARLYHATPDDVLEILRELPDEVDVAGVVGHNPTLHCLCLDLVSELSLTGPHPALNAYPPGTLCIVELPVDSWSKASFAEGTLLLLR